MEQSLSSSSILLGLIIFIVGLGWLITNLLRKQNTLIETTLKHMQKDISGHYNKISDSINLFQQKIAEQFTQTREKNDAHQFNMLKNLTESLNNHFQQMNAQLTMTSKNNTEMLVARVADLNKTTDKNLKDISQQVERRLHEGFEKTTNIFNDVTKRLHLIDKAQQKITELSTNVVSLQDLLADRKSRGALGEVQLNSLIRNMLPENHFSLQHTLSNNKRVDCLMFLPEPTGNVAIDAKFPLESYKLLQTDSLSVSERNSSEQRFRQDIRRHIDDISGKYIIPGETADGAVLFIPAEAIFAEIHSHYPELVEYAHTKRVWLVSPTTLMAILTTARAVLKDEATRKQVHIIKQHLGMLAKDFSRFKKRMDNLSRHIDQAQQDVHDVKLSAVKLTSRFNKIEKVELDENEAQLSLDDMSSSEESEEAV